GNFYERRRVRFVSACGALAFFWRGCHAQRGDYHRKFEIVLSILRSRARNARRVLGVRRILSEFAGVSAHRSAPCASSVAAHLAERSHCVWAVAFREGGCGLSDRRVRFAVAFES